MKTLIWNNAKGQEIKITLTSINNMIDFEVTIDGANIGQIIGGLKPVKNHPVIAASLGKLGLTAERAGQVSAAIVELEAKRKSSVRSDREKELDEFDRQGFDLRGRMEKE